VEYPGGVCPAQPSDEAASDEGSDGGTTRGAAKDKTMADTPKTKSKLLEGLIKRPEGRPLPVVVLADTSGSMQGEKIAALNEALRQMIESFRELDDGRITPWVSIITFDDTARVAVPPSPAHAVKVPELRANGRTAMGAALGMVRELLEDRARMPGSAYTPNLVLVSDGQPNDEWQPPLEALLGSQRAGRGLRLAMAIGSDADETMLKRFVSPEIPVVRAAHARRIRSFFQLVTFTVAQRSKSHAPNQVGPALLPPPASFGFDDDDLVY